MNEQNEYKGDRWGNQKINACISNWKDSKDSGVNNRIWKNGMEEVLIYGSRDTEEDKFGLCIPA